MAEARKVQELDLVWGSGEIAKIIGRTERQVYHLLTIGALPAKKVGGSWVASRSKLLAFFLDEAA